MHPPYRGLGVSWCEYKPAKGQSPKTPNSRPTGDSQRQSPPNVASQVVVCEKVTSSETIPPATASRHEVQRTGDSPPLAIQEVAGGASAMPPAGSDATGDPPTSSHEAPTVASLATAAGPLRRPLTDADIAKALAYVECGLSLRAAAAEIGRHHSTLLKRIKSDTVTADAFGAAREKARSQPLAQIREASKTSWRAAAWLVKYLDARAQGGHVARRGANVPKGTSSHIGCPKSSAKQHAERELGENGGDSELLLGCDAT